MTDDAKVTVDPEIEAKPTGDEPIIDNPRQKLEEQVIAENDTFQREPEAKVEIKEEVKVDDSTDPLQRIKENVQKRIDKVIAQRKSVEEDLVEARAEIAQLKKTPEAKPESKLDNSEPTIEQVEAYIIKMRQEGNVKEEIAAQRYLIKLEKESAIKEVEERQTKTQRESQAKVERENQALLDLAKDYIQFDSKGEVDMKSDLTLANQDGKLFKAAMLLYSDPELKRAYYNDPDRALGFRKAVQDANRELHQQGMVTNKTPKVDQVVGRTPRVALADPESVEVDESPTPPSNLLSDAEKVREEIKSRTRMRTSRRVS